MGGGKAGGEALPCLQPLLRHDKHPASERLGPVSPSFQPGKPLRSNRDGELGNPSLHDIHLPKITLLTIGRFHEKMMTNPVHMRRVTSEKMPG